MIAPLTLSDVTQRLAEVHDQIRSLGVDRLAVFGSVRRNEARPDSDVDFLVHFLPGQKSLDRLLDLGDLLESVLDRRVELVTREALSPYIGPHILADATDVLGSA